VSQSLSDKRQPPKAKRPLKRMFDSVPGRYDLMNRVLTLRLDERWRKRAATICIQRKPNRVLDLCCGTGDLALHLRQMTGQNTEIVGLDYSPAMLEIARSKTRHYGPIEGITWVVGDASSMQFPDGYFDVIGVAFGFRNLTWKNPIKDSALSEVKRILRPGGAFVVVETSQPTNRIMRMGFHAYLKAAVGTIGAPLSGNRGAYRYLAESARRFYDADDVSTMLAEAGLEPVRVERLLAGAAAIHVAENRIVEGKNDKS